MLICPPADGLTLLEYFSQWARAGSRLSLRGLDSGGCLKLGRGREQISFRAGRAGPGDKLRAQGWPLAGEGCWEVDLVPCSLLQKPWEELDICGLAGLWDGHLPCSQNGEALTGAGGRVQPLPLWAWDTFVQEAVTSLLCGHPGDSVGPSTADSCGRQRHKEPAPWAHPPLRAALCFLFSSGSGGLLALGLSFLIHKMGTMACALQGAGWGSVRRKLRRAIVGRTWWQGESCPRRPFPFKRVRGSESQTPSSSGGLEGGERCCGRVGLRLQQWWQLPGAGTSGSDRICAQGHMSAVLCPPASGSLLPRTLGSCPGDVACEPFCRAGRYCAFWVFSYLLSWLVFDSM